MKSIKINKFKTQLPKKSAFTIETEDDFPKLHTLCVASGKRGGGKSVAIANFVKKCKDKNYYDKLWLISPTYHSNKQIWDIADIEEEDVFEPDINVLKTITGLIEAEREEWDDFLMKKELYKKYKREIANKPVMSIRPVDLIQYMDLGFLDNIEPEWKYPIEQAPRLGLIIDDAMGTDLMAKRTAGLTNFCIKHRHLGRGLGVSVFMLVQSYCALGGVPRPIRENTTHLLLFKINDEKQIQKVKEESDLPVTDEEWESMCEKAHSIPYNFLLCEFAYKCPSKMFRSGWDNYLIPPSLEGKCKCNNK